MRLSVDRDRCCSSGMCVWTAPDIFDQSEADGTVVLLLPEPPARLHDPATKAAADCPCRAITVVDDDGADADGTAVAGRW